MAGMGREGAATKRWLEEYFEQHNRRLYEHLGAYFRVVALNAAIQAIEQRYDQDTRPVKWGSFLMGRFKSD